MCSAKELSHNMDQLNIALKETNAVAVETQLEMRELSSGMKIWKETKCAAHDKAIEDLTTAHTETAKDIAKVSTVANSAAMKAAMVATVVFVLANGAIALTIAAKF